MELACGASAYALVVAPKMGRAIEKLLHRASAGSMSNRDWTRLLQLLPSRSGAIPGGDLNDDHPLPPRLAFCSRRR